MRKVAAIMSLAYTMSGGLLAFAAILAIDAGSYKAAIVILLVAYVIDATDGTIARAIGLERWLRWVNFQSLDGVIDILNYAIVPLFLAWKAALLPEPRWFWAAIVLAASFVDFAKRHELMPQGYYSGLPAVWNIAVFYLFYLRPMPAATALVISVLALLAFTNIRFVYPSRHPTRLRYAAGMGVWLLVAFTTTAGLWENVRAVLLLSLVLPAAYFAHSAWKVVAARA